jgi:hypothetical protein
MVEEPDDDASVRIRLSRTVVHVPRAKYEELIERLMDAGVTAAAEELQTRQAFQAAQKPEAYGLLNTWLDEVKVDTFGQELMCLRHELDADIIEAARSS